MSFYTGRYVSSHGATSNLTPLRLGERNIGDHLKPLGVRPILVGKTHIVADKEGMERLGVDPDSIIGVHHSEAGFEVWERDDGFHPDPLVRETLKYNTYLKERGYEGQNPWHWAANSVDTPDGVRSGFLNDIADHPARVSDEESETPYMTRRAMAFLEQDEDDRPWLMHLSYIKPHWPYIAPAPYHAIYGANHVPAPMRRESELADPHPVLAELQQGAIGKAFHSDETRSKVIPAYMGLIKQCDDQLGRLLDHLEATGQMARTMIVLTSDHGDYLGDHWMGEKMFMHEASVKIPMIVYDPSAEADGTRGTTCDALVESIDLAATFIEVAGGEVPTEWVEGRSLVPFLHGQPPADWRQVAISEYTYAVTATAPKLGVSDADARLFMAFDGRYKLIHFEGGLPAMLFDLREDPEEFTDLGRDPGHETERQRLYGHLNTWARRQSQRVTRSAAQIEAMRGASRRRGIILGAYAAGDVPDELMAKYVGPAEADYTGEA